MNGYELLLAEGHTLRERKAGVGKSASGSCEVISTNHHEPQRLRASLPDRGISCTPLPIIQPFRAPVNAKPPWTPPLPSALKTAGRLRKRSLAIPCAHGGQRPSAGPLCPLIKAALFVCACQPRGAARI